MPPGSTGRASSRSTPGWCCRSAGPALAATGIFTFQASWEDFFWPLIIVSSPDKYTAPLGLALFAVEKRTEWDVLFAGSLIATLPMIVVFLIFQRQFIQGISVSGMKG